MEKQFGAFLIVEKGDPYGKGETLQLAGDSVLLGRRWEPTSRTSASPARMFPEATQPLPTKMAAIR